MLHADPKSLIIMLVTFTENDSVTLLYTLVPVALPVMPTLACNQSIGILSFSGKFTKSLAGQTELVFSNSFVRSQLQLITAPLGLGILISAVMFHVSFVVEVLYVLGLPTLDLLGIYLLLMFTLFPSSTLL